MAVKEEESLGKWLIDKTRQHTLETDEDDEWDPTRQERASAEEILTAASCCPPKPMQLFWKRPRFVALLNKSEPGIDHIDDRMADIFDGTTPPEPHGLATWVNHILCDKLGLHLHGLLIDQIDYDKLFAILGLTRESAFGMMARFSIKYANVNDLKREALAAKRQETHRYRVMARDYYLNPRKAQSSHDLSDFYSAPVVPISYTYVPLSLARQAFLENKSVPTSSSSSK